MQLGHWPFYLRQLQVHPWLATGPDIFLTQFQVHHQLATRLRLFFVSMYIIKIHDLFFNSCTFILFMNIFRKSWKINKIMNIILIHKYILNWWKLLKLANIFQILEHLLYREYIFLICDLFWIDEHFLSYHYFYFKFLKKFTNFFHVLRMG